VAVVLRTPLISYVLNADSGRYSDTPTHSLAALANMQQHTVRSSHSDNYIAAFTSEREITHAAVRSQMWRKRVTSKSGLFHTYNKAHSILYCSISLTKYTWVKDVMYAKYS